MVLAHKGEKPNFLHVLVEGSIEFFSAIRARETTLSFLSPPRRLHPRRGGAGSALSEIGAHHGKLGRPGSFRLPSEKKALANLLGMRPENLSRAFGKLAGLGVKVEGATVTIVDRAALTNFARPDRLIDDPST